ncbi:MAG: Ig-like domain-containing protein [bacterium]
MVLKSDDKAAAWGYNNYGQLGDGTTSTRYLPVQVSNGAAVVSMAGGYLHSLAVKADGTVWGWGRNNYGQVGDRSTTTRTKPVRTSNLVDAVSVSAGYYHSLAVRANGTVWGWGYNYYGQLGNGRTTNTNVPTQVSNLAGVASVAGGMYHSLAVKSDGTAWAWGRNNYGQLGDKTVLSRYVPVLVSNLTGVASVGAGYYHSLAVKADGTVWAWGYNNYGQLGNRTTKNTNAAYQVSNLVSAVSVAGGYYHSLALKSDGTVWAWGRNNYGQLGFGNLKNTNMPMQVSNLVDVVAIACGENYSMAVKSDGSVWAWGYNSYGQLGDGTRSTRYSPVRVSGVAASVVGGQLVLVSDNQTTTTYDPGILNENTLYTWQVAASDNHGASSTGGVWQFHTGNQAPLNNAPVASNQSVTVTEDVAKAITLTGSDPEMNALTYTVVTSPTKGTLSGTAPNLTYTPNLNVNGADSFTFRVSDGLLASAAATVSITITAVNDAPVANSQSVMTPQNTAKSITLTASDVENSPLTYSIVVSPSHGALSGTLPNVTYTPANGYSGADSFTFRVSDGVALSVAATVSITVEAGSSALYVNVANTSGIEDGSAAHPYNTIQEAIAVAVDGGVVLVAQGRYVLASQIEIAKGVTVRGAGGSSATMVDGNQSVRCFWVNHSNAVVEGFTITRGRASEGLADGGGVLLSQGLVDRCVIVSNISQSAQYYGSSRGGGVTIGGGILRSCLIRGNVAVGTAYYGYSDGGGIYCGGGAVQNCTVVGNSASAYTSSGGTYYGGGGGVYCGGGKVQNSIIYGNATSGGPPDSNCRLYSGEFSFSCSTLGLAGEGNIVADPRFANPNAGDFHLVSKRTYGVDGSPCVDAGMDMDWMVGSLDLDGRPRVLAWNGMMDMGAYEQDNTATVTRTYHWAFDEGSGTIAHDASALAAHATLVNAPAWVNGKAGKALTFDGDDYGTVGTGLAYENEIAIQAWIKVVDDDLYIASKGDGTGQDDFELYFDGVDKRICFKVYGTDMGDFGTPANSVLSTSQWYHIVAAYDGATAKIFLFGDEKASTNVTGNLTRGNAPLRFGQDIYGHCGRGTLDELKIVNRALRPLEIKDAFIDYIEKECTNYYEVSRSCTSFNAYSGGYYLEYGAVHVGYSGALYYEMDFDRSIVNAGIYFTYADDVGGNVIAIDVDGDYRAEFQTWDTTPGNNGSQNWSTFGGVGYINMGYLSAGHHTVRLWVKSVGTWYGISYGVNLGTFSIAPLPMVTSVSPVQAPVGAPITIRGANLFNVRGVAIGGMFYSYNGTPYFVSTPEQPIFQPTFTVDSPTRLTAVWDVAVTGAVKVLEGNYGLQSAERITIGSE